METETQAEFEARIKEKGLDDAYWLMVGDLKHNGRTNGQAIMEARDALTPEGVEMLSSKGDGKIERVACEEVNKRRRDHEATSTKTCSIPQAVQWAFDNIGNPKAKGKEPGPTALVLHEWIRKSEANKKDFITGIWPKLMPSTKELDNQARYSDDGSKQIELAERILARIENGT